MESDLSSETNVVDANRDISFLFSHILDLELPENLEPSHRAECSFVMTSKLEKQPPVRSCTSVNIETSLDCLKCISPFKSIISTKVR